MLERFGIEGETFQARGISLLVKQILGGNEETLQLLSDSVIAEGISTPVAKAILTELHEVLGNDALATLRSKVGSRESMLNAERTFRATLVRGMMFQVLFQNNEVEFFVTNLLKSEVVAGEVQTAAAVADVSPVAAEKKEQSAWMGEGQFPHENLHFSYARHTLYSIWTNPIVPQKYIDIARQHYIHLTSELYHATEDVDHVRGLSEIMTFLENTVKTADQAALAAAVPHLGLKLILLQSGLVQWTPEQRACHVLAVHGACCAKYGAESAMAQYCVKALTKVMGRIPTESVAFAYADFRLKRRSLSEEAAQAVLSSWNQNQYTQVLKLMKSDPTMTGELEASLKVQLSRSRSFRSQGHHCPPGPFAGRALSSSSSVRASLGSVRLDESLGSVAC